MRQQDWQQVVLLGVVQGLHQFGSDGQHVSLDLGDGLGVKSRSRIGGARALYVLVKHIVLGEGGHSCIYPR